MQILYFAMARVLTTGMFEVSRSQYASLHVDYGNKYRKKQSIYGVEAFSFPRHTYWLRVCLK